MKIEKVAMNNEIIMNTIKPIYILYITKRSYIKHIVFLYIFTVINHICVGNSN